MSSDETMPCPKCGREHKRGEYKRRAAGTKIIHSPDDVVCECGELLVHTVPVFYTGRYGWHWRIVERGEVTHG